MFEVESGRDDVESDREIAELTCALDALDIERASLLRKIDSVRRAGQLKRMRSLTEKTELELRQRIKSSFIPAAPDKSWFYGLEKKAFDMAGM